MSFRNIFHSIAAKFLVIMTAMALTTAIAVFVANSVFQETTVNLRALNEQRLPELSTSEELISASNALSTGAISLMAAESSEDLDQIRLMVEASWNRLQAAASGLDPETSSELNRLLTNVAEDINALTEARSREFSSIETIDARIQTLRSLSDQISRQIEEAADEAFFALVIGGEDTVQSVSDTLERLVAVDLRALQIIYEIRSEANLASGVSLALTQTTDTALVEIFRDLSVGATNRLSELVPAFAEMGLVEFETEAFETAVSVFQRARTTNARAAGPLRPKILEARRIIDTQVATIIDELVFNLEINSETASVQNSETIQTLLQEQVEHLRLIEQLDIEVATFLGTALETALAVDKTAAEISQEKLVSTSTKLTELSGVSTDEIGALVMQLLAFADPIKGLIFSRIDVIETKSEAILAAQRAMDGVTKVSETAAELAKTSREKIYSDSTQLLQNAIAAQSTFQQIVQAAIVIFALSVVMTFRWIVRPMSRLTRTTERLAQGDLSEITGFGRSRGEVGRMAEALQVFRDGLVEKQELHRSTEAARKLHEAEQELVVTNLADGLVGLANRDLDVEISVKFPGEYGKLREDFNSALTNLKTVIEQISWSSTIVKNSGEEISSASQNLSVRTERSAAALEESAVSLTHLSASIKESAERAKSALTLANDARTLAGNGQETAKSTVAAMERVSKSSKEVRRITEMIDDIAFQTNLLALNAGVEAARAGDSGKGFAVVASEVRALAQKASHAASEISTLLASSSAEVDRGVESVNSTELALRNISECVAQVAAQVQEIATSSQDQATSVSEIDIAVSELDRDTQQNVAMFEETTAACLSLSKEANCLANAVSDFKLPKSKNRQALRIVNVRLNNDNNCQTDATICAAN